MGGAAGAGMSGAIIEGHKIGIYHQGGPVLDVPHLALPEGEVLA